MNEYSTIIIGKGARLQSGIPTRLQHGGPGDARGLLLRGVVTATYVLDDPDHPMADSSDSTPRAVYCDVMTYGRRYLFLPRALVSQNHGGIHSGKVWKPRAATMDITGSPMDLNKGTNPANLDGDHVIVEFLDGNFNQPIITGALPHPQADLGNEQKDAGHRMRLKKTDGDPDFWKHHGAFYGVSDDGDFVVDLTEAWAGGDLQSDGKEPAVAGDGTTGNYKVRLPAGASFTIELDTGENLKLELKDGGAKFTLGDGAVSIAIADYLQTLYGNFKTIYDVSSHPTGTGPSGPPTVAAPAWDAKINSTKARIPGEP